MEKRVISFGLWGCDRKYLIGAEENCKLAKIYYPDWKCRFYVDKTAPISYLKELHDEYSPEIYFVNNTRGPWYGLFFRFYIADDETVDRFIIRDCDSRLNERESVAVEEWIKSDIPFHCMKDHPWQMGVPILGGMWGAKKGCIVNMKQKVLDWLKNNKVYTKGPDQFFLRDVIWPLVKDKCMEHDEISTPEYRNPKAIPFPTKRNGYRFVGEIFDEYNNPSGDEANQEHWKVLKEFLEKNNK